VSFLIRAMAAEDLDRVLVLAGDSVEAPRWTRQDYERIVQDAEPTLLVRCGLVAVCGSNLVGFVVASWLRQETVAEVEGLFVERAYRRRGIGGALIAACMAWARTAGASTMRLEVRASNVAALALYQRYGFSAAGVRRDYYSAPLEDALLLQAPLFPQIPVPL
jgi:[ribosomal protein S18]-alanine N-acetyltransferase